MSKSCVGIAEGLAGPGICGKSAAGPRRESRTDVGLMQAAMRTHERCSQGNSTVKTVMLQKDVSGINGQNGLDKESADIKVCVLRGNLFF